jgi:hypothetical protein
MDIEELELDESDLRTRVLPRLIGQVFHITSGDRFERILNDGAVLPNPDGSLDNTLSQVGSIGRDLGLVCLFDLRDKAPDVIESGLSCFGYLAPAPLGSDIVILVLKASLNPQLLQWEDLRHRVAIGAGHIPHLECWHDGPIPVAAIAWAFRLRVRRRPVDWSSVADLIAEARRRPLPKNSPYSP